MGSFCIIFFDTGKRRFSKIEVCQRWHQERFSVQLECVFQWDRQTDVLENYKCGSSGAQQFGKCKKGNVSKCTLRGEKGLQNQNQIHYDRFKVYLSYLLLAGLSNAESETLISIFPQHVLNSHCILLNTNDKGSMSQTR